MAVMKATYVFKDAKERSVAKDFIRYIQHRPGKDKERTYRNLFGLDGYMGRHQAYRLVDDAPKGRFFYRLVVSPDPMIEDHDKAIPLRELIEATILALEERLGQHIGWVAAIHDDHTDKRHIHALAVVKGRLKREDLQVLREAATQEAQLQREARDLMREVAELQRQREEAQWTI